MHVRRPRHLLVTALVVSIGAAMPTACHQTLPARPDSPGPTVPAAPAEPGAAPTTARGPAALPGAGVPVKVSPNARLALAAADTMRLHAFQQILRDRTRWGSPDPDVSELAAYFAEDAIMFARFGEIYRGRAEIVAWLQRMLGFGEIANMRLALGGSDGVVYVMGRYRHLIRRPDGRGRLFEDLGTYTFVWERQRDGVWRIQAATVVPEPNPGSPANPYGGQE